MARQEVGKVQEMLMTSQQDAEEGAELPLEVGDPSGNGRHGAEQTEVSGAVTWIR